jgi:hypothetical protein
VRHAIEGGGRDDFAAVLAAIQSSGALEETRATPGRGKARNRRDFGASPFQFQGSAATIIGLCSSAKTLI